MITLLWQLAKLAMAIANRPPCDYHASAPLADGGVSYPNGSVLHEGLLYPPDLQFHHGSELRGCTCAVKKCIRKCCPVGEVFVVNGCVDNPDPNEYTFDMDVHYDEGVIVSGAKLEDMFAFVHTDPCGTLGRYPLDIDGGKESVKLLENGHIKIAALDYSFDIMKYCIDRLLMNNNSHVSALVCFPETEEWSYEIFSIAMITSLPFLFVTMAVYCFVPELRNVHGKALMGYVSGLFFAYIFLIITQRGTFTEDDDASCIFTAFGIYFSFMVSLFWLNVLSFDIWWTFRTMEAPNNITTPKKRQRRFIVYAIYAWGMPIILTGFLALMEFHPDIPDYYTKPKFGENYCWFDDDKSIGLYFYLPMVILVVCNIILFTMTAFKIRSIKKETAVLNSSDNSRHSQFEKHNERFNLYLKLFTVMGINWVAEWTSFWIGGQNYIWVVTDLCNTLQGIFIFIIFICKKKIKNLVLKRYYTLRYGIKPVSSRCRINNSSSNCDRSTEKSSLPSSLRVNFN